MLEKPDFHGIMFLLMYIIFKCQNQFSNLCLCLHESLCRVINKNLGIRYHLDINTAYMVLLNHWQHNYFVLSQVTNEKVRALMELARWKQDYQLLKE